MYKAVRLGLNKKPFIMYKFRTLPEGAQKRIGSDVLTVHHHMTTPFTKFLRDTRIDELPQLYNVLKGDMDFVGPRPVRPEMYQEICRTIKGYDLRFKVKPGLIGYSQLFTPHNSPKLIRSKIDNQLIKQYRSFPWTIYLILYTIIAVLKVIVVQGGKLIWRTLKCKLFSTYRELRQLERVTLRNVQIQILSTEVELEPTTSIGMLVDINEECFKLETNLELSQITYLFLLRRKFFRRCRRKIKKAYCHGEVIRREKGRNMKYVYVVKFQAASSLNKYFIDQYFLKKSLA